MSCSIVHIASSDDDESTATNVALDGTAGNGASFGRSQKDSGSDGSGVGCDRGTASPSGDANADNSEKETPQPPQPPKDMSWGRGIVSDYKKTVGTHWKEEMTNFNQKTVAATFFLFFACIAPAITFGGIYAKVTHNQIGAVEMLIATAWCGIVFALTGGQPMMINGGTGPVLAFAGVLYKMSESLDLPYLTFSAYCGFWVCLYMMLAAFFDWNRVIRYCTRFTDEIFAMLIAAIFIIDALGSPFAPVGIYYYFEEDHKSHDEYEGDPDYSYQATAVVSLLLCIGTTGLAFLFRRIKFSPFCCNQMARDMCCDFAVVASILIMTLVANLLFGGIETEKLNVPDTVAPTFNCCTENCDTYYPDDCPELAAPYGRRPWLVDLGDLNGKAWMPFLAAVPAFLAFILIFLDDGITKHLINHPCHKLCHGDAYNYDTVIIGLMIAINSILGFPWLVAATVRSMNHIHAMAEKDRNGKFVKVQETRLTALFIHTLILASIFALSVLKLIPMPVLYGVFLFMGLSSLGLNQFFGRVLMFFMQPSKYPKEPYTEGMVHSRMHFYTIIQLTMFVLLYLVKSIKVIAIAFPVVIALCIPLRLYGLPKIFTDEELILIDTDEETFLAWLSTLTEEELMSDRLQPLMNFEACSLNKPPKTLDDDDGGVDQGPPTNGVPDAACAVGSTSVTGRPPSCRSRQNSCSNRNRQGSCPRRVRQSTAATEVMGQDDDMEAFWGDVDVIAECDQETVSSARTGDASDVVDTSSANGMKESWAVSPADVFLGMRTNYEEEKCEDDSSSICPVDEP